ncbi:MAG: glycosyltransferase family 2 protein [Candidatus Cloacimonadales bacterium]|jgi:glycosyltransferase involved in cell wall biosynthesis|nr:glycosyltransferase family 2 protein [Candidatus Cloacimonadota bacterium]MDD2651339.1 glycosyltransferase family 2 protein [Candidatus Cloacimonadota bacterium]MDD3501623.1 glycosyltransferase family 2 protein [Candidatus Cloacimonadota bacterium]MDX9977996.1 glycosyltransferase family 2 protein [Candidatus Cloacimonadales bacterium]
MKVSFVIPVLNEEDSLKTLYEEILENVIGWEYEFIFVDDGSTDKSLCIMKEIAEKDLNVKVISFRKNFGKSAALHVGFKEAKGDIVFTLDADLQDNPKEIPKFVEQINAGYDLVTGWKEKRLDPITKTLPSKLFNFVTSKTFKLALHDYNCGFKAYKKEVVNEIDVYGEMHRYIPALAKAKGFKIKEISVEHRSRKFGKSKYGFERYLRGYLDLLTVKLVTDYSRSPLYLFGGIGTILSLIGLAISLYLFIMRVLHLTYLSNRPILFFAVLLVVVGVQFISIGLIGELLVNQNRLHNKYTNISIKKRIN